MDDIIRKIFQNKLEADDNEEEFTITPDIKRFNGFHSIREGRGYGIPIACFADTSDKIVFTPAHLGYTFDYDMGEGNWGEHIWEDESDLNEANEELFNVGKALSSGYKVWFVYTNSSESGHNGSFAIILNDFDNYQDLLNNDEANRHWFGISAAVLFVFGLTKVKIQKLLKNNKV